MYVRDPSTWIDLHVHLLLITTPWDRRINWTCYQKPCVLSLSTPMWWWDEHQSFTYQADIWLSLSGCSDSEKNKYMLCWKNKINGLDMHTVTYCRLSSLSLPSCVVSLFLPWGGDGRFLQGKSNNLSRHRTFLHLENIELSVHSGYFSGHWQKNSS